MLLIGLIYHSKNAVEMSVFDPAIRMYRNTHRLSDKHDLYLTLSGAPLQTDHILISDIGLSDNTALTCWNWMTQRTLSTIFAWYHRHKEVNRKWYGMAEQNSDQWRKAWTNTNKDVWCFSQRRDSHLHIFKQGVYMQTLWRSIISI